MRSLLSPTPTPPTTLPHALQELGWDAWASFSQGQQSVRPPWPSSCKELPYIVCSVLQLLAMGGLRPVYSIMAEARDLPIRSLSMWGPSSSFLFPCITLKTHVHCRAELLQSGFHYCIPLVLFKRFCCPTCFLYTERSLWGPLGAKSHSSLFSPTIQTEVRVAGEAVSFFVTSSPDDHCLDLCFH